MRSVTRTSRYSLLAAALAFGLSSPAALAETVTVTDITSALGGDTTLTIPTVELTDATLTEDQVRGFFAGGTAAEHFNTLLNGSARSITIPEIDVKPNAGAPGDGSSLVLTGITFTDVANGIVGGFSIESAVLDSTTGDVSFGPFSIENVNLERIVTLLGHPGGEGLDPRELDTQWSALSLGGATVGGPDGTCTIAGIDGGAVAIRMMQRGTIQKLFAQINKVQQLQSGNTPMAQEGTPPAGAEAPAVPEAPSSQAVFADELALLQSYYYDALSSYAADPVTFSGIDCNVTSPEGDPIVFQAGEVAFGEAQPGTLPEVVVSNLRVENSGKDAGWIDLQEMRILSSDYSAVAALFDDLGTAVDGSILTERQRELIPSVGGFEITGLSMDVPSEQSPDTRIVGGIDAFALTFDSYVNGIPTDVRSSATNISFEAPKDESGAMLASFGLDPFTLSYDVAMHWDRAAQEIVVDNLMLSADNAGTVIISGVLGNAKPQLFSLQPAVALKAGQALTVKELHFHVADAGLLPQVIAMVAGQQNVEPDQFKVALGAMVQGMVLVGLGGTPDSIEVAGAINTFLNAGGDLSLSALSLSPAGVGMAELQESGGNPSVLKKFAITVGDTSAEEPAADEPVEAVEPEATPASGGTTETPGGDAAAPESAGESKDKGGGQ